jgi:S1-C subfamily serine protease
VQYLRRILSRQILLLLTLAVGGSVAYAQQRPHAPSPPMVISSTAERVYEQARPKLLQVRTLVSVAGRQSSIGSGFLVGDGLAITNYHVVSKYALEPQTYRLEYTAADGTRGELKLAAVDLANDLAVVRLAQDGPASFEFDDRALNGTLPKGERLYSMGNPLDIGFTIVEGTYNGLVERSYNDQIHFAGALNPGMSGGPTVTGDGRIAGINVAKRLGGELVSFLVPARFAVALLDRAESGEPPAPSDMRAEIGRQLVAWQTGLYQAIGEKGFRSSRFGPYEAPESAAPWFDCWARTSAGQVPQPRAARNMTNCSSGTRLFVADDLNTGVIQLSHSHLKSEDLNDFQFATFLSRESGRPGGQGGSRKWYSRQRCHEDFIAATDGDRPALRAVWCARAYREFEGIYDVWLTTITQDRGGEALVSRINLRGVTYDNATALAQRFLESVKWAK